MNFTETKTSTLLALWKNLKKGLDEVDKSLKNGTFKTPGQKGAAPPSQSGQTTLWFAMAVDQELTKRNINH